LNLARLASSSSRIGQTPVSQILPRARTPPCASTGSSTPQSKPQGTDEAKLLSDSRRVFMSCFADYELHDTKKYGESFGKQWDDLAGLMKGAGPAAGRFRRKAVRSVNISFTRRLP
jgi:hypothetical protein